MPYNRIQVQAFLTKPEVDLFESSLAGSIKLLAPAALNRRIERARTLRDKYRDLLQRQKLATRSRTGSKGGTSGHANERTDQKAVALDEALKRFESEAARRDASAAKSAAKGAAPVPARVALRKALEIKQSRDPRRAGATKPARSSKAPAVSPAGAADAANSTPPAVERAAVASQLADANLSHIQGHTSTQVRRSQAKRDNRK